MSRAYKKRAGVIQPVAAPQKSAWPDAVIYIILAVSTVCAYAQVRGFDFVNYDDPPHVSLNSHVRAGLSPKGLEWALTSVEFGNWFPVTRLSYLIDREWFGLDPGAAHLVNLFFHAGNALLLLGLIQILTGSRWRPALVAGLFALHPLRVEPVAWISARKDVLSGFFWFAALLAYTRYVRRPSLGRYLPVAGAFCLGLMSKPIVVTLPVVLLAIDFWPLRRVEWNVKSVRVVVREKVPLFALSAASCLVTYLAQSRGGAIASWEALPFAQRLANAAVSYATYITQTFWPTGLAVFYPMAPVPWTYVCASLMILLAVTALAVRWAAVRPWFAMGWFWYLITLLPAAGLIQVGAAAHADRYTYLPSVGIGIIVAWACAEIAERRPRARPIVAGLAAAGCAACLVLTVRQTQYWANSVTLFQRATQVTAGNWVAYNNLGAALRTQGETDEGIANFRQALAFRPGFVDALVNLCEAYNSQGHFGEGALSCREALAINPESPEAHGDLGGALGAMGQTADAIPHFLEALRLRPDDPKAYNNLGIALATQGRLGEAIDDFQTAVRLDPGYANAEFNLGAALANSGRLQDAVTHLSTALRIHPDDQRARQTLTSVSARLQQEGGR